MRALTWHAAGAGGRQCAGEVQQALHLGLAGQRPDRATQLQQSRVHQHASSHVGIFTTFALGTVLCVQVSTGVAVSCSFSDNAGCRGCAAVGRPMEVENSTCLCSEMCFPNKAQPHDQRDLPGLPKR